MSRKGWREKSARLSKVNNGTVAQFVVRRAGEDESTKTQSGEKDGL